MEKARYKFLIIIIIIDDSLIIVDSTPLDQHKL